MPELIGMLNENEIAKITFDEYIIQTSKKEDQNFLQNLVYKQELSMIIDKDDKALSSLNSAATTMRAVMASVMGASVVSQAAMSHALQNLWAVINSLQLLSYMAFLYVNLTPHLFIVYQMLLTSHFDAIPLKDAVTEWLSEYENNNGIQPEAPFTENMGLFGYETQLVYVNLLDGFMLVCVLAMIFLILQGVKLLIGRLPWKLPRIYKFVDDYLAQYQFNAVIRTFVELYLDIALFSFIGFVRFKYSDASKGVSTSLSLVLYPLCIAVIPYAFIYIKKKEKELLIEESKTAKQVGTLVEGCNVERSWSRSFLVLFTSRRLFFTLLFCLPKEYYVLQLTLNLLHCIAQVGYLVVIRPYILKRSNFQETFNEIIILLVAILMFQLTDLQKDYQVRTKVSWAIIFLIFTCVIFNLCLIIYLALVSIKEWLWNWLDKKRAKKYELNTELAELKKTQFTLNDQSSKKELRFMDPSMRDFVLEGEEVKEGIPHLMKFYLPEDSIYEGRIYRTTENRMEHFTDLEKIAEMPAGQKHKDYANNDDLQKYKTSKPYKRNKIKKGIDSDLPSPTFNKESQQKRHNDSFQTPYGDDNLEYSRNQLTTVHSNFQTLNDESAIQQLEGATPNDKHHDGDNLLNEEVPPINKARSERSTRQPQVVSSSIEQLIQEELKQEKYSSPQDQEESSKSSSGGSGNGSGDAIHIIQSKTPQGSSHNSQRVSAISQQSNHPLQRVVTDASHHSQQLLKRVGTSESQQSLNDRAEEEKQPQQQLKQYSSQPSIQSSNQSSQKGTVQNFRQRTKKLKELIEGNKKTQDTE